MMILRVTSNLGGQKEDKGMMCSITPVLNLGYESIYRQRSRGQPELGFLLLDLRILSGFF
jgi:hypothetical protein